MAELPGSAEVVVVGGGIMGTSVLYHLAVVSSVPGNPAGLVAVFGPDGAPLGIVEGSTLTGLRTGAAAGLATELLARPDAQVLAMLTCATPATAPLFDVSAVAQGTHVNAIGAFTPEMVELPAVLLDDSWVVVDDRQATAREAGDLIQAGRDPDAEMSDLLAGRVVPPPDTSTVYKSCGAAGMDLAAALAALRNAS